MSLFEDVSNWSAKATTKAEELQQKLGLSYSGVYANPPATRVRTSHAVSIRVRGVTVGLIQSWGPNQTRTITPVYEVNLAGDGSPVEKVPGTLSGLSIQVSRYDLYTKKMESAFGSSDYGMLSSQHQPFSALELWRHPDGTTEGWLYSGCWFSTLGRTLSATDARVVLVNATLEFTRKDQTI